nr:N-glycosylase/DNA lyase [Desulfurococcales archaeon]
VSKAISLVGLESIMEFEEKLDPQYGVMRSIVEAAGEGPATVYGLLAGIVSYKLAMPGEEWWECFKRMIAGKRRESPPTGVSEIVGDMLWFLDNCRGSIIGREAKKARIRRVYSRANRLLASLIEDPRLVARDPLLVARLLASSLDSEYWRKTIVFALKLAYYAVRARGLREPLNASIPIPVDQRVACASISSGIIRGARGIDEIVSKPMTCQRAWFMVSEKSGVPSMHIDSLLWVLGRFLRELPRDQAVRRIASLVSTVTSEERAVALARELAWRGGCM